MVRLTDDIKGDLGKVRILPLATATPSGEPNVVPMGMVILQDDDETFWIIDNFMQKTLRNVTDNPKVALYVWSTETTGAWQIKGTITSIETDGPDHEKAKAIANARREGMPAKTLLKMKVTEAYSVSPGPNAGKKVL